MPLTTYLGHGQHVFLFLSCFFFIGCKSDSNKDSIIVIQGFIIYDNPEYWYFVSVGISDTTNCFIDLGKGNKGKGFQFNSVEVRNLDYLQLTFDSMFDASLESKYLKISPVKMQAKFSERYYKLYASDDRNLKWNFQFKKNNFIAFTYNIFPVQIQKIEPLFCFRKKEQDIPKCSCNKRADDANDYLFKICSHVKEKNPESYLPCRYNIKSVDQDTLYGKVVTKISLSCCYLGDVAYFDNKTKELIKLKYGAK